MPNKKNIDWSATLAEYQASDCTVNEFCAQIGVHPNTFYRYQKKHQPSEKQFVKLPLKPKPFKHPALLIQAGDFLLKIPDGVDADMIEKTLRALKDVI
jgi:hypothetical protein